MAPSFSMTLRRAVFSSCFTSANFVVITARYTHPPTTTTNESGCDKKRAASDVVAIAEAIEHK
jgi:hypothetical protein